MFEKNMHNPWLKEVVDEEAISELREVEFAPTYNTRCVLCKGTKLLCGKLRCPVLVRAYVHLKTKTFIDSLSLEGASPPAVFVGRIGYPYVAIGPLIPPLHDDTSLLDTPEFWTGKSIDEIVEFRAKLVRGKYRINVTGASKITDGIRELALSRGPTEVKALFTKKPAGRLVLDENAPPFGPSAPLKKIELSELKIDPRLDKAYTDTDLKAAEAVIELYRAGALVSKIQRAFSVGALGLEKKRKFVPTRWSITAVDSIISKELIEKVKYYHLISDYEVYEAEQNDRKFIVLLIPREWSYELIEAWYPGTVWNPTGARAVIYSSFEPYEGRTKYAEIGGCYYAARLACTEFLTSIGKQASAIVFSEAYPGYIMPLGVWHVRENVRLALREKSNKFDSLEQALNYISTKLRAPILRWLRNSNLLKSLLYQKRIEDYLKEK
ncbi:MAG: Nre family DNA repair protein [Candidatus Thermoplasmatota archaeon]|nr:Nre family DNA repair protein [Candidatus Thermoplasmatota archaeon]